MFVVQFHTIYAHRCNGALALSVKLPCYPYTCPVRETPTVVCFGEKLLLIVFCAKILKGNWWIDYRAATCSATGFPVRCLLAPKYNIASC